MNYLVHVTSSRLKTQTSGTKLMQCLALADSLAIIMLNFQATIVTFMRRDSLVRIYMCKFNRVLSAATIHLGQNIVNLQLFKTL